MSTKLAEERDAYYRARATNVPVALSPLPNGVTVVINPNGVQNNLATPEQAQIYIERQTNASRTVSNG